MKSVKKQELHGTRKTPSTRMTKRERKFGKKVSFEYKDE